MDEFKINFIDKSQDVNKIIHERILVGLEACGLLAERLAKMECPVDTGRLRNSITHATSGQPAKQHTYAPQYVSKLDGGIDKDGKRKHLTKKQKEAATVTETIPAVPEKEEAVYLGTNVEYAPIIELGGLENGRHRAARPFLKSAFQDHKAKYKAVLEHYLKG